ncbi:twin-arginine translocase TatA/TatE family subunit [Oscillatoria amoena NRMC-F 0135]|nr:twin-arginine translocase TatA/TatE family subunit [Oscillatoria amoena NRMC-F 0135]
MPFYCSAVKKIPELMRGLGSGIREFNDAKNKVKDEIQEGIKNPPPAEKEAKTESK